MNDASIAYVDFAPEHVSGVLDLDNEVFPVRYPVTTIQGYLNKPNIIAVAAVMTAPVAEDIPVLQERVIGFISCRVEDSNSFIDNILGKKQLCE